MIRKLGNKSLLLILVALLAVFAVSRYYSGKKGENTFQTAIIPKIDTTRLTGMIIYPKIEKTGKPLPYIFTKKGEDWYVSQGDAGSRATPRATHYMISQMEQISPDRLGTNDPKDWKQYNVNDSLGTRVILLYRNDTALDIVIGRFSYFPAQRQAISYVRLWGQKNVYAVDGFLSINVVEEFNNWRDKQLMPGDYASWTKLTFTYPADSGFVIEKNKNGRWAFSNGSEPDSAAAAKIIQDISNQNYGTFVNKFDTGGKQALFTLRVEGSNFNPVLIKAYPADTANLYALNSSANPGACFSGKGGGLFNKVFPSKSAFYKKPEAKAVKRLTPVKGKKKKK